jgi:protein SCO1/2
VKFLPARIFKDTCNGGIRPRKWVLMDMRPFSVSTLVYMAMLALSVISCSSEKVFQVNGIVKEVLPDRKQVSIEHEKIPGYMAAMTMTFDVKESKDLEGIKPGDKVAFRMIVTPKDGWIDQIKKTGTNMVVAETAGEGLRRVREVDPLKEGDQMPDYHFTNELGQAVSLSDFKGKALALSFIFTRCPFPTFCPRMSDNFAEAQKQLKTMPNAPTNWHLLTISFDPEFDTPSVLKSYAKRFQADPKHWSFATGELIDVTAITEQFGLLFWKPDPQQPTGISHNLRTVVIDAQGRVQKILPENSWKPDDLVREIVKAAAR